MVVHTYGNIVAKTKKHEMNEQGSEHKEKESENSNSSREQAQRKRTKQNKRW